MNESKKSKSLKDKAMKIQGKDYVMVKDRIIYFNEMYPNGGITTRIVSWEDKRVVIEAQVVPDFKEPARYFTGHAQEIEGSGNVNRTSALENCETSAVGRALAMMAIGVVDEMASVDEMKYAKARVVAKTTDRASTKTYYTRVLMKEQKDTFQGMLEQGEKIADIVKKLKNQYTIAKVFEERILTLKSEGFDELFNKIVK